ncbi:hypothetical protein HPC49_20330 [Pyxidicoccus fallax]|uniref:Uncharacterized protein n=1 Tax=Pyxidicoccus fallax TaxID=394095 RepID=A0A848LPX9_9BACT|nr:hypothetical protein [Pyxidicoccus fallax]NMO19948.1 hypothetical protein [Pyxidicoccus fallax]NPC80560.1 hypothetical protein [Pyxidicoccus fallax]
MTMNKNDVIAALIQHIEAKLEKAIQEKAELLAASSEANRDIIEQSQDRVIARWQRFLADARGFKRHPGFSTPAVAEGSLVQLAVKMGGETDFKTHWWLVFPGRQVFTRFIFDGRDIEVNSGQMEYASIVDMKVGDELEVATDGRAFPGCRLKLLSIL